MISITLEAPAKNALGSDLVRHVTETVRSAGDAPILITGSGDAFSAGLDLKEVARLSEREMVVFLDGLDEMVAAVYQHPAPTVAAVNGHAIAGGCILALACDFRVAARQPRARIGLNEVALGLQFPPAILKLSQARIPRRHQAEVLLGAGLFSPEEALRLGLIDELADDAVAAGTARLERLASLSRSAYAATKRAMQDDISVSAAERETFLAEIVPLWTSDDLKQRLARVLSKKKG